MVELDDRRTKLGDVPQAGEARSRVVNRDTGMREVPPQLPSRGVVVVDREPLRDLLQDPGVDVGLSGVLGPYKKASCLALATGP